MLRDRSASSITGSLRSAEASGSTVASVSFGAEAAASCSDSGALTPLVRPAAGVAADFGLADPPPALADGSTIESIFKLIPSTLKIAVARTDSDSERMNASRAPAFTSDRVRVSPLMDVACALWLSRVHV